MNTVEGKVINITSSESNIFALTDRGTIYVSNTSTPDWTIFETKQSEKEIKLSQLKSQTAKLEAELAVE